jgi:hypothetical protein
MFFDMAIDSFRGSYGTSHGRTYADGIVAGGLSEASTGLQRIAWGMGNLGGAGNSAANFMAAGKRYKVARTIQIVAGLGHVDSTDSFPIEGGDIKTTATTVYVYSQWAAKSMPVTALLGLSYDRFNLRSSIFDDSIVRHRINPKLGVVWSPDVQTTLRASVTSSVKRPFVGSQTLEPTQVAGFNQFFTGYDTVFGDRDGTVSRRGALAFDHRFSDLAFVGAEVSARKMQVPTFNVGEVDWKERTAHAYFYRALQNWPFPQWQTAMTADFAYERIMRPQLVPGPEGIVDVHTQRLPLGVRFFSESGLVIGVSATYVKQSGVFAEEIVPVTIPAKYR